MNLLSLGESHTHVVKFGTDIHSPFKPGKLGSCTKIVGAFVFTLDIERRRHAYEHPVEIELTRIALCRRHHAFGLKCEAAGIEQRRYVPVVAECLGGAVDGRPRAVEYSGLIAPSVAYHAVNLDSEIKSRTDLRSYRVQRMWHYDRCSER